MTRRTAPGPEPPVLLHKISSILLQYPDDRVREHLDAVTAALPALPGAARDAVGGCVGWLAASTPAEAAQHYVATFDHTRRRSLYLTYYRYGDTRNRGLALLALKHLYRATGFAVADGELPDYLPLMLEFAVLAPESGQRVLGQCRAGLELLSEGLHEVATPYAGPVDAIRAGLPELSRRDRDQLRALAQHGPPAEQVGLEPFTPAAGGQR